MKKNILSSSQLPHIVSLQRSDTLLYYLKTFIFFLSYETKIYITYCIELRNFRTSTWPLYEAYKYICYIFRLNLFNISLYNCVDAQLNTIISECDRYKPISYKQSEGRFSIIGFFDLKKSIIILWK